MLPDSLFQAFDHLRAGRHEDAARTCQAFLAGTPDHAEANHLLAVIRFQQGRASDALVLLQRAVAAPGATAEMHNNHGAILNQLGKSDEAITAFERALALKPNYADALNNLGVIYRDRKQIDEAIAAFQKAVDLDPEGQAKGNLRSAYRDVVPPWHFAMMDDHERNAAYDAAIRRAVPGKRVLDIGTGAGLLAMMAARAGAAKVTGCETVGVIAARARAIFARNGFGDRINVLAKPSTDLVIGRDLPERAQVLVTETFASSLIGEGILPTLEHAHEHLLTPDSVVIPATGAVAGYLAGGDTLKGMLFTEQIAGFDLSQFNDFAPARMALSLDIVPHDVLSDDVELLRFDFKQRNFPMTRQQVMIRATNAGTCCGIAQWIRLDIDREHRYENRPAPHAGFNGHWAHILHRFPRLVRVQPGDVIAVEVRHDRSQVLIDLLG